MKVRRLFSRSEKTELQMTPMIDIVFQLLVFFVMTFKIVSMEGDFDIKMPRTNHREGPPPPALPPLKLELAANSQGELVGMQVGNRQFTGDGAFEDLRGFFVERLGGTSAPQESESQVEVELAFDYNLKYTWVVQAMDSISGYPSENGEVVRLVEKIKLTPPQAAPPQ